MSNGILLLEEGPCGRCYLPYKIEHLDARVNAAMLVAQHHSGETLPPEPDDKVEKPTG